MYFHVWFVTKYRRKMLTGDVDTLVKGTFSEVARNKEYDILEAETDADHVHMLVRVKDRKELSAVMRVLKAVSAKKVLEDAPHVSVGRGQSRHFWAKRYGWRAVPKYQIEAVRTYIREQKYAD